MTKQEQLIFQQLKSVSLSDGEMTLGQFDYSLTWLENNECVPELIITLPFPLTKTHHAQLSSNVEKSLANDYPIITLSFQHEIKAKKIKAGLKPIPKVKNIIAIASGKGGVGKSTLAANLAVQLKLMGVRVGLLDADLYGPSQTLMMGVRKEQPAQQGGYFLPVVSSQGIEIMSMGFLVDDQQAVVWRGPMISKALQQLLFFTKWGELDYLIVDLPPGTGDTQLTLSQKIPVTAALVVTTPQEIALIDAAKAISMFDKVSIPVLGVVENMSYYVCPCCHYREPIFGTGGGRRLAESVRLELLGEIPLASEVRDAMDTGELAKMKQYAKYYELVAWRLGIKLSCLGNNYNRHFSNIVVET